MHEEQTNPKDAAAARSVDELVHEHLSLARSLAWRYRNRGETQDDLTQVAYLGLVMAAQRYREGDGPGFAAYAVPTITGELRRHFRDKGWEVRPPRRLQEIQSGVREAEETLRQRLSREPTSAEVGEYLGVAPRELMEARSAAGGYTACSLDAPTDSNGGSDWVDHVPADSAAEESLDQLVDSLSVQPLLDELSQREQLIIALRYYQGCTQQQIADQIGVTQMQVSRLLAQSLARLRAGLLTHEQLSA
jgi:RNA polymerase sigma-B factor